MTNRLAEASSMAELLEAAIEDFELQLRNPNFRVSMGDWISKSLEDDAIYCGCLAGACLMTEDEHWPTLLCDDDEIDWEHIPLGIRRKMSAINELRLGNINAAYRRFYQDATIFCKYDNLIVMRYSQNDSDGFLVDLRNVLAYLKKKGI